MALKRIDKFMNSEELKSEVENIKSEHSKTNGSNGHSKDNGADAAGAADKVDNGVEIADASFQWESNQVPLDFTYSEPPLQLHMAGESI